MSVRYALLALLSEGEAYGLRLREEFESRTGEVWPLNAGQVYSTLQRLERDGLVSSAGDAGAGPKRTYRLLNAGHEELLAWLAPPAVVDAPPRDELVIKVLVGLRVHEVDAVDLLQSHRAQLVTTMQHYTHMKEDVGEDELGVLLVADAEIFRLDAMIRWLDAVEARLRQSPPGGGPDVASPADRPAEQPADSR